jgi:hypothetical protein
MVEMGVETGVRPIKRRHPFEQRVAGGGLKWTGRKAVRCKRLIVVMGV